MRSWDAASTPRLRSAGTELRAPALRKGTFSSYRNFARESIGSKYRKGTVLELAVVESLIKSFAYVAQRGLGHRIVSHLRRLGFNDFFPQPSGLGYRLPRRRRSFQSQTQFCATHAHSPRR